MATYFVNPSGSSTNPYDTPAKGTTTLGALVAGVVLGSGDIVEVVQGTITETVGTLSINSGVTIRSYSSNTSKPLIRTRTGTGIIFPNILYIHLAASCKLQNLVINDEYSSYAIAFNIDSTSIEISNCCFTAVNFGNALIDCGNNDISGFIFYNNVYFIKYNSQGIYSGNVGVLDGIQIINNTFIDVDGTWLNKRAIHRSGGCGASTYIVNNIIYGAGGFSYGIVFNTASPTATVDYNDIYNVANPYFNITPGIHSIITNPALINSSAKTTAGARPTNSSPCKNTGADNTIYVGIIPTTDYFGISRPNSLVDMGFAEVPLAASFTASPMYGTFPLTTSFTNTTAGLATSWNWSFGDGSSDSTVQNPPNHTYSDEGRYPVVLSAQNNIESSTSTQYIGATVYVDISNSYGDSTTHTGTQLDPYSKYQLNLYDDGGYYYTRHVSERKLQGQCILPVAHAPYGSWQEPNVYWEYFMPSDAANAIFEAWNLALYGPPSWYDPRYTSVSPDYDDFYIEAYPLGEYSTVGFKDLVITTCGIELDIYDPDADDEFTIAEAYTRNCYIDAASYCLMVKWNYNPVIWKFQGCSFILRNFDGPYLDFEEDNVGGYEITDSVIIAIGFTAIEELELYAGYGTNETPTAFNNCYFSSNIKIMSKNAGVWVEFDLNNGDPGNFFDKVIFTNCHFNYDFGTTPPTALTATIAQKDTFNFETYNIPEETNPAIIQRWTDETYNTDLFGNARLGAGAWYFQSTPPIPPDPTNRYWVAVSDSTWNDTTNWSMTSGGSGGISVPDTTDNVIFDGNGPGACTINTNVSIRDMTVNTSYNSTIDQSAYQIILGDRGAYLDGGRFRGGSGDITSNGDVFIGRTTFISTSSTFLMKKDFTYAGQLHDPSYAILPDPFLETDEVTLTSGNISDGYINIEYTAINPNDVPVSIIGGTSQIQGTDYSVANNRVYFLPPMSSILLPGDKLYILYDTTDAPPGYGAFYPNNGRIIFDSTSDTAISGGGVSFYNLNLKKTGNRNKTHIGGNINIDNSLEIENIVLTNMDIDGTNGSLRCYKDATASSTGLIGPSHNAEIKFMGGGIQKLTIGTGAILPSLTIDKTTNSHVITYGEDIVVNDRLYVKDGTMDTNGQNISVGL